MEDILGLNPIVLSIVIIIAGVGLQNVLGWLKSSDPPNPKKIATSVLIGAITSFGIVTPIITQLLETPGTEYMQFVTIVGAIAMIAGIDALVKNTGSALLAKTKKS